MNTIPTDPVTKTNYTYGTNANKTEYQIAAVLENPVAFSPHSNSLVRNTSPLTPLLQGEGNNLVSLLLLGEGSGKGWIIPTVHASQSLQARVNGNYRGFITFSSGASNETWIANIPSLLVNFSGSTDLLSNDASFIVDKQKNLPYKIDDKTIIHHQSTEEIILAKTKSSTAKLIVIDKADLIAFATNPNNTLPEYLGSEINSGTLLASFGSETTPESLKSLVTGTATPPPPTVYENCTFNEQTVSHNTSITAYETDSVSFGNTCTQEQRLCTNGTLAGTYTFS